MYIVCWEKYIITSERIYILYVRYEMLSAIQLQTVTLAENFFLSSSIRWREYFLGGVGIILNSFEFFISSFRRSSLRYVIWVRNKWKNSILEDSPKVSSETKRVYTS